MKLQNMQTENTKTKNYDLQKMMEEFRTNEGIPEELTTEAQLWDEILKKEVFLMGDQLLPLIKEVHHREYPRDVSIKPLATEYSVNRADSGAIASIRADITVMIAERDIYHLECQTDMDGTMVMRMLEYDVPIAISYAKTDENGIYQLQFPHSAVLYLQSNRKVPDFLTAQITFQDGSTHDYTVPVIKVQAYTLEEIRDKHLCILIPFLPLRFRPMLKSRKRPEKEELTDFLQQIIIILEEEVEKGFLTNANQKSILSLLCKSMIRVFYKDETLLREVVAMTEPILELEFEKIARLEKENKTLEQDIAVLEQSNIVLEQSNKTLQEEIAHLRKLLEEKKEKE